VLEFGCAILCIGEDVSEDKDGGILKSQIKKGEGYATPKEGASCESKKNIMHFELKLIIVWRNFPCFNTVHLIICKK